MKRDTNVRMCNTQLEAPNQSGWWEWHEGNRDPVRLLIAGDGDSCEVATDAALAEALGRPYDPNIEAGEPGSMGNYWEMTPCKEMGGKWKLIEHINFDN